MSDRKPTQVSDRDFSEDERALHAAIGLPSTAPRSDAAFRARVRADVQTTLRRRRFALLVPVVGGACALATFALLRNEDPTMSPRAPLAIASSDDGDAVDSETLAEEEALRLAALDAIAADDDEEALVGEDFDDDTLVALGSILDARLARVTTR